MASSGGRRNGCGKRQGDVNYVKQVGRTGARLFGVIAGDAATGNDPSRHPQSLDRRLQRFAPDIVKININSVRRFHFQLFVLQRLQRGLRQGKLVPFRDAKAIAVAVVELLRGEPLRHTMRKNACKLGRELVIPYAMSDYATSFATVTFG